jgi:hypothetical protein
MRARNAELPQKAGSETALLFFDFRDADIFNRSILSERLKCRDI